MTLRAGADAGNGPTPGADTRPRRDWLLAAIVSVAASSGCAIAMAVHVPPPLAWLGVLCAAAAAVAAARGVALANRTLAVCRRERAALPDCVQPLKDLAAAEVVRAERDPADVARADDTPGAAAERTLGDLPVPVLREQLAIAVRAVRTPEAAPRDRVSEASTVWEVEDLRRLAQDVLQVGLLGGLIAFLGSYLNWRTGAVVATLAVGAGVLARYAVTVSADALNDAVTLVHVAVTETVADRFVGVLPRELAVPERRLEISLRRHLDTQAERLHDLLADGLVGPAQALADHAGALAGHSAAWGEVARELAASAAALSAAAQEQIDRIGREADRRAAELADRHAEAARQMAADMRRAHDEVLQAQSRQSAQALLDTSREVAETVAARAADVEARVADAVASLRESLPAATGSSVERAVAGAVDLTNLVRDQAGGLAQAISQISQNAARHLEAYDRWAERVDAWQAQLEQLLRDTGARHESLIVGWQQRADESMGRVERTLSDASNANARAIEGLKTWLATVVEQMVNLRGSLNELNAGIDDVRTAVDAVRGLVTEMEQSSVVLGRTTESAARALTVSAAAEVKHASALQEATEQLRRVSDAVGRLDGLRGGQEGGRQ